METEDVRAAVVADGVELLAACPGSPRVDLGVEHALLADQGAGQYLPFGTDDDAVTAGQPVAGIAIQVRAAGQVSRRSAARMQEVIPIT